MDINLLEKLFENLKLSKDPFDIIFDFKKELLSSDDIKYLELHYKVIQDEELQDNVRSTIKSFFFAEAANKRRKEKVADFLYNKYLAGIENVKLKADVIQLLGNLKSKYAKEVALENITIRKGDLRYRSIIVLGWVGDKNDLEILNDRLMNDPDPQLRCYGATAMRQIWFNYPKTKETILKYLKNAIVLEKDSKAVEGIVITAQDLLKKKLGIKESKYGDISGDINIAKVKTEEALKNY